MELFDTHFHYYAKDYTPEAYHALIGETMRAVPGAPQPDRLYTMAVGGNYLDSCGARAYAETVPDSWFSVGVHPHEAELDSTELVEFRRLADHPRCRAIGELGLDYYYDTAPREQQRRTLDGFLALALELKLPAILHCRDKDDTWGAYEEMYAMLRDYAAAGGRMVVHCFAGTPAWAERFLELGSLIGVTGIVTFPRAGNIRETLKVVPDDRLLLETDSPYLAPVPCRGKPNTPGYLPLIAARVALERGVTVDEIARITTENAFRFFDITERGEC